METGDKFPSQLIVIAAFALIVAAIYVVSPSDNAMPPFPSPEGRYCDDKTTCPAGYACYKFPDNTGPVCFKGDPCSVCNSKNCTAWGRYPVRIECQ